MRDKEGDIPEHEPLSNHGIVPQSCCFVLQRWYKRCFAASDDLRLDGMGHEAGQAERALVRGLGVAHRIQTEPNNANASWRRN